MNEVPDIYTNTIRAAASLYEFIIILGLQTPGEGTELTTEEVGYVRMSPQQAMALHLLLGQHLEAYGEKFTEIFLPDDLALRLKGLDGTADEEGT